MGKKKGKNVAAGGEKGSIDIVDNGESLEANGDNNANLPKKNPGKSKKKAKKDDNWEDDVANELAQLALGETPSENADNKDKKSDEKQDEGMEIKKTDDKPQEETSDPKNKAENNGEPEFFDPGDDERKKKKKKGQVETENGDDAQEASTVKTKAQKNAEKKEREKKKKERQKQEKTKQGADAEEAKGTEDSGKADTKDGEEESAEKEKTSKKKKKAKKDKSEAETKTRKKPGNKMLAAMKDQLQKQKEEEERLQREIEEKERKEEEERLARLKKVEDEKMRKERKKQKEKERIKRQKAEGKYLTPQQKEAQRKRELYVESLREQGLLPVANKQKAVYTNLKKAVKKDKQSPEAEVAPVQAPEETEPVPDEPPTEEIEKPIEKKEDDVADDWEAMLDDSEEEQEEEKQKPEKALEVPTKTEEDSDEEESEEDEDSSEEESSEEEEDDDDLTPRERAEKRIEDRKRVNEGKRSMDDLRSPVICVMGHVDTGKTKILDKIRHSHVQDGEAGGITQQIGATFVPMETIQEQTSMVKAFQESNVTLPGLLVIDTPGHESFSNLRARGSSVCDMAILVVDIMHGLESQTIESITMLKKRKTPFVVALNKVDRLYEWKRGPDSDIVNTIKKQKRHVKDEFEERVREIVVEFAKENLNVKLFHENNDPKEWISMVPTSAHSGDGMGNLIALVMQLCQTMLPKRLSYSEELQTTVLEVKAIQGLGTTIDVILTNGRLKCGDTIVLAGVEGPIVSHVKGLLMPQPLKELRVKNPYNKFDELKAAQGVKIVAKDLDKALAGTQLLVANKEDEIEILKQIVQSEVDKMLKSIKLQERGVFVQASTLGSLEALLEFLKQSKIPYAGIGIGPVHKRDIMKASVMLEHDSQWAVILAFDVKVEREAQDMADHLGVKVFTADIIYHLFDAFMQHREDLKKQKQEEFRTVAVFPCKIRIMPNCVFKSRDPIVVGVVVSEGQLRPNTPLCIPSREFLNVGYVTSMEFNHKPVEVARAGQEVCIKIEGTPGEPPKMVGRHFEETDILTSKISRESINAVKDWFREDMQKSDWQLIIELKKLFEII